MALRKIDLVEKIYNEIGLAKKGCMTAVDSLFEIIKKNWRREILSISLDLVSGR
jgi:nucleoid DNA-binding protein